MFIKSRIVVLFVTAVFLTQWQDANSLQGNETQSNSEDGEAADAVLENMNFAEFKERYRRLIPYMTYFVANNYVNSQVGSGVQTQQGYEGDAGSPISPLITKPRGFQAMPRPGEPSRDVSNGRVVSNVAGATPNQDAKFVPSVQYDPKDPDVDADYFTPIRYEAKLKHDAMQYSGSRLVNQYREHARQQQRPNLQTKVTSAGSAILQHQDNRYYLNEGQSSRPYDHPYYEINYLPQKSNMRVTDPHQDYLPDYGTRVSSDKGLVNGKDYSYTAVNGDVVRHVNVKPIPGPQRPKPTRILAQSQPRLPLLQTHTSPIYSAANNPSVSLENIMRSLQLTNRLPEVLDKSNIDSSLKTLIEILGILNNPRPIAFSRSPVTNAPQRPDTLNYDRFKQAHARPSKVVTETLFQATPRPHIPIQEQLPHYESEATYDTNNGPEITIAPNYEIVNNEKYEKAIEYYRPLPQNTEKKTIPSYKPIARPLKHEQRTEYKYGINEDLEDDVRLGQMEEKYVLPITTEVPIDKFKSPGVAAVSNQQLGPPITLEYGATRGKPNIDYPVHATIPETQFNCKEQRYKGFFGDPSTGCQVWHYCDLNGGKSSFLCPNGTVFSQVALTCDWWFNVKCESTTQLYVLNERLYKYILPLMPKFPEDFSGPEVDRYLELKFKEMEAKLKEKKLKKQQEKDQVKDKLQSLESDE